MESSETPHQCFNGSAHEINEGSFQLINQTFLSTVKLLEEEIPTGGFFRSEGFALVVPANSSEDLLVSWPYAVGVLDCNIQTTAADTGNMVQGVVGPNTVVGMLTSNADASSEILAVSSTVISNVHIGMECVLGGELVGEIVGIDGAVGTITINPPLTQPFTTGTLVGVQRRIIKNFNLGYIQGCAVGSSKIGASYIPAGVATRVTYINNTPNEKTFNFNIEYLY
jgi:hypothetical protein